jgi:Ca2+-binding EF-hand superfamily protein
MYTLHSILLRAALLVCVLVGITYSCVSLADDVVSFATGGYARGIRSEDLMHKMNTSGNGMLTKDEWLAFHEKIFVMLDKNKTGVIDAKGFISADGGDVATFATGGYARGLRTKEMMAKIDTDGDGTISHDEFIAYLTKIFDMMDTSTTHKGMISKEEVMFATGGYNRR